MKVLINLGKGNLHDGCNNIVVQLLDERSNYRRQINGSLPAAPRLAELYQQWQSGYSAFYQNRAIRIGLLQEDGFRYSETDFKQVCQQIPAQFNSWLNSELFAPIEKVLRANLSRHEPIQIIITALESELQKLPWHLWQFLDDYNQAEITFSTYDWQIIEKQPIKHHKTKILVVLGNSKGIDLTNDLNSIILLPETEITVLSEPHLSELNEYLWQSEGWDILLFSGHSYSDLATGYIYLNDSEKITIAQLKYSLTKAIANGLQIAIFNSCDGVGLALQLADLSIPYTIVMSEPVADRIAQVFLKYFLIAFTAGKTFTLAVKEARQKLAGWETEFICASWLPMIWQNPTVNDITWQDFQKVPQPKYQLKLGKIALASSLIFSSLLMVLRSLSWLEPLEFWAYDRMMQQRPLETIDPRILVVEITEEDTNRDRYPISDRTLVEAIQLLNQHQPAAIGLDIHRSYQRGSQGEYQDLIELFETNSHIFPICSYSASNKSYAPPMGLSKTKLTQQMGFSDLLIDNRQTQSQNSRLDLITQKLSSIRTPKVRRQLLSYETDLAVSTSECLTPYSLSFQLAYEYLQQAEIEPLQVNSQQQWQFGDVVLREMSSRFGGYQQLDGKSSQIMVNYRSGEPGKRITLSQLLDGIEPQLIQNRIVLIGYSASVARDYFDTPYGIMSGVWIHAHQTSHIISAVEDRRSLIWVFPQWGDWLCIFIVSLYLGIFLMVLRKKHPVYYLLALGIFILAINRLCILVLIKGGWLPYIPLILSLLAITTVMLVVRWITFETKKAYNN